MKDIFLVFGRPFETLSHLGNEFENQLVRELFNLLGMHKLRSSGYRPQTDVGHWMSANRLKLNADKTELLWAGSRRCCLTYPGQPSSQVTARR